MEYFVFSHAQAEGCSSSDDDYNNKFCIELKFQPPITYQDMEVALGNIKKEVLHS